VLSRQRKRGHRTIPLNTPLTQGKSLCTLVLKMLSVGHRHKRRLHVSATMIPEHDFTKKIITNCCTPKPSHASPERTPLVICSFTVDLRWQILWDRVSTLGHASSTEVSGHEPLVLTKGFVSSGDGFGPPCQLDRPLTSLTNTRVEVAGERRDKSLNQRIN